MCDNCHFTMYCSNTFKVWWTLQQPLCYKFLAEFNSEKISKSVNICQSYRRKYRGPFFDSQWRVSTFHQCHLYVKDIYISNVVLENLCIHVSGVSGPILHIVSPNMFCVYNCILHNNSVLAGVYQ